VNQSNNKRPKRLASSLGHSFAFPHERVSKRAAEDGAKETDESGHVDKRARKETEKELAPSRTVFVGNIPFDASTEELVSILGEVGTVVQFRHVFDKETKRAKGFGFCEYQDKATALSAIRNLNGREVSLSSLAVAPIHLVKGTYSTR
jgi:RNA recognition motif-containing protein